jgi:hypothetical protein
VVWEIVLGCVAAVGSVIGSVQTIRLVMKREQRLCDARLDAFKQGLKEGRRDQP